MEEQTSYLVHVRSRETRNLSPRILTCFLFFLIATIVFVKNSYKDDSFVLDNDVEHYDPLHSTAAELSRPERSSTFDKSSARQRIIVKLAKELSLVKDVVEYVSDEVQTLASSSDEEADHRSERKNIPEHRFVREENDNPVTPSSSTGSRAPSYVYRPRRDVDTYGSEAVSAKGYARRFAEARRGLSQPLGGEVQHRQEPQDMLLREAQTAAEEEKEAVEAAHAEAAEETEVKLRQRAARLAAAAAAAADPGLQQYPERSVKHYHGDFLRPSPGSALLSAAARVGGAAAVDAAAGLAPSFYEVRSPNDDRLEMVSSGDNGLDVEGGQGSSGGGGVQNADEGDAGAYYAAYDGGSSASQARSSGGVQSGVVGTDSGADDAGAYYAAGDGGAGASQARSSGDRGVDGDVGDGVDSAHEDGGRQEADYKHSLTHTAVAPEKRENES